MKNFIIKAPLPKLKSSMSNFTNIVKDSSPWGRRDIMRQKKLEERMEKVQSFIKENREKLFHKNQDNVRFTIVKRIKGGFKCSGIGEVQASSFAELKNFVKNFTNPEGKKFNRIKMGCIVSSLN